MKYIIMCGGNSIRWETPRHLIRIRGEPIVARTIRLLREQGVEDISISSNNPVFEQFGVPVLRHENDYTSSPDVYEGCWCNGFYPTQEPACYLFGDVVFSTEAIRTIVEAETKSIQFFASSPPFAPEYTKPWAEPFALKVADQRLLRSSIQALKQFDARGLFRRRPIMWELWSVITVHDLNSIDYGSYVAINDYTCDIDYPEDVEKIEKMMPTRGLNADQLEGGLNHE